MKNSSDIKILVYTYLYVHKKLININSYGIKLFVINFVKKFRNIQENFFLYIYLQCHQNMYSSKKHPTFFDII